LEREAEEKWQGFEPDDYEGRSKAEEQCSDGEIDSLFETLGQ